MNTDIEEARCDIGTPDFETIYKDDDISKMMKSSKEFERICETNPKKSDSLLKDFDILREELKQQISTIYSSSHNPCRSNRSDNGEYINEMLKWENEEIKYNEDTPYTMSVWNTRHNTLEEEMVEPRGVEFKKYSLRDIEESLVKYYKPAINKLDILIIYLNGQKYMYLQSHRITLLKLNLLYFPCILLTSFTTFFAPFSYVGDYWWSNIVLSCINAVILIFIAMINYLKLESAADKFFQLYSEYEKININIEFFYNRLLEENKDSWEDLWSRRRNKSDEVRRRSRSSYNTVIKAKHEEIESLVQTLRNYFSVVIPDEIQSMFPVISHLNIFAFIKKMEDERNLLIQQFYHAKNEIRYILYKQKNTQNIFEINRQNKRINYILKTKEKIKLDLSEYKTAFAKMEEIVMFEIKYAEKNTNYYYFFIKLLPLNKFWNRNSNSTHYNKQDNKIIDEYLKMLK